MAQEMGIGQLGGDNVVFKRKFRWTLELQTCAGDVPKYFVKVSARPSLTIEETEINFLNAKSWIPGKGSWETLEVTYYDVAKGQDSVLLLNWLASVYDFTDPINLFQSSTKKSYAGRGILTLFDGCGTELEAWTLSNMFPTAVNWGDLDYSSSDICEIVVTMRYSEAKLANRCGAQIQPCPCKGC